jgi:hypothetical protein
MTMCPNCISKLYFTLKFEVELRQQQLVNFYEKHGLEDEYTKNKAILSAIVESKSIEKNDY